jgi:hypothetical protein
MAIEQPIISFLQSIVTSAIVSGGVSAFVSALVNYVMTMKALKKKNIAEFIENKLDIYSFIIFYLDRMRLTGEALKKVNSKNSEGDIRKSR